MFLANENFLTSFKATPDSVADILVEAVKLSTNHWNQDERTAAEFVLQKLVDFQFALKVAAKGLKPAAGETAREKGGLDWRTIVEIAAENEMELDGELDLKGELEKVRRFEAADVKFATTS
jgi:hypothetical protein